MHVLTEHAPVARACRMEACTRALPVPTCSDTDPMPAMSVTISKASRKLQRKASEAGGCKMCTHQCAGVS